MTTATKPLVEITQSAIRVLVKELGVVDTIRFVNQFTPGYGDYTAERQELLAGMSLDEIVSAIKQDARRRDAKARS